MVIKRGLIIVVAAAALLATRGFTYDPKCGPCAGCKTCRQPYCCSFYGYCGLFDDHCGADTCISGCPFTTPACDTSQCRTPPGSSADDAAAAAAGVMINSCATTHRANITKMGDWMEESGGGDDHRNVFCRQQPAGSNVTTSTTYYDHHACGECLKVTELKTGTQTMVRFPTGQECSNEKYVDLRKTIFKELSSEEGIAPDYLIVAYQAVHCNEG